ncbi:MAG: T9SS type A sorting domain-containing protein [Bacteroidia bacterium]
MKKKILVILVLLSMLDKIQAQYLGGDGDGSAQLEVNSIPLGNYFVGITSNFTLASNWSKGTFPTNEYAEVRSTASNQPVISSTIILTSGTTIAIQSGASLTVNSGSSFTLLPNSNLIINGTVTNNGTVLLKSDEAGSANIGKSSGTFNGNLTVERFVFGGKRAFRFFSHPFNSPIALSNIMSSTGIIITGPGGATNGFDDSQMNNPSVFSFSESTYDGTNNSGWNAYTNSSSNIAVGSAIRALHRGARTQLPSAVQSNPPTPLSATISWMGAISIGLKTFNMTNTGGGTNAGWNLIGNPYPSSINIGQIINVNRNSIGTFAVWNPNLGTTGGYETKSFGSDYILPSGSAFFINTPTSATFSFTESDKSTSTSASLFKKKIAKESGLVISLISESTIVWDNFVLRNERELSDEYEYNADGLKMKNSQVNIYSISSDNKLLAIDNRPLDENKTIDLVIESSNPYHFSFKINQLEMEGLHVYLVDNYLNNKILLKENTYYHFNTNTEPKSQGLGRFQIKFANKANKLSEVVSDENLISLYPNPSYDLINLIISNSNKLNEYAFEIYNPFGILVKEGILNYNYENIHQINIENLETGIYFIKLNGGKGIKFIKL